MPDLSNRPTRYATAIVTLALAGAYVWQATDLRVGSSAEVTELRARNAALERELVAARAEDGTATSSVAGGGLTCAAFGTQEEAQAYWAVHATEHPDWDGNANGVACEQLKTGKPETDPDVPADAGSGAPSARATGAGGAAGTSGTSTRMVTRTQTQVVRVPVAAEPAAPAQAEPAAPAAKPTAPSKATIVASRQHFGLYAATQDEYDAVEASVAKDTTIHGWFQGWDTRFRPERVNAAWAAGEIPMLSWESRALSGDSSANTWSLDSIAAGAHDAYVRQYARDIAANGLPLVIRFDHEMNGTWYRWSEANPAYGNSTGSYIRAWQHVHDVFTAEGANDLVIWDWAPNRVENISAWPSIDRYYPGDAYVDWVGMTGYYRYANNPTDFDSTYAKTLAELRRVAPGKPILLSEVGATENGGDKVAFLESFFPGLVANPDVIGFVWFDYAVSENGRTNDWRIASTAAALDAFRTGIYATGFGRDRGKQPVLVTTPPVPAAPTGTPTGFPTPTAAAAASPTPTPTASPTVGAP